MRNRALFLFAVMAAVLLAGCKDDPVQVGGKVNPKKYATAVSLNPGAFEIMRGKFPGVLVVGRTAQDNWPTPDDKIPVVMNGIKPNYEKIAQLRPGMVVYDSLLFSESDIEKVRQLGIETFAIQGDTIEKFIECLYDMGRIFHGETQISEYIEDIHSSIAAAAGAPPAKKLKVAIMIPGQGGEHLIAGVDSFYADAVRAAQGEPVGPKADRFVPVSAESLVSMNPDVIVTGADPRPIFNDPRLQAVAAVKAGRAAQLKDADILMRRGGRVDKLIKLLYQAFSSASQS